MTKFTVNTDGGSRGNPGPAAIGIILKSTVETTRIGKYIGHTTNNVAEYSALIEALKAAKDLKATELECLLDSELVVKQLNGLYKVKDTNMRRLWAEIKALEKHFKKVGYKNIPRAQNSEADTIVNEILDSAQLTDA